MVKYKKQTLRWWKNAVLAAAVFAAIATGSAVAQPGGVALLLQHTPTEGGRIAPDSGVHTFEMNSEVTLTAIPEPGYQFVYWLGDVSDPVSNRTTAYMNTPKIVIAVFERVKYEFLAFEENSQSTPVGGLHNSGGDYATEAPSAPGGKRPSSPSFASPTPKPPEKPSKLPVPDNNNNEDIPVPKVPEPATMVFLAVGGLYSFTKYRRKK